MLYHRQLVVKAFFLKSHTPYLTTKGRLIVDLIRFLFIFRAYFQQTKMTKENINKSKNEGVSIVSHQQSTASRITKKKQRRISERCQLKDAWNTPEFLAQFTSRTRQRKSTQANQTVKHAKGQVSEHAAKGQQMQQTEDMAVDPSTHVNTPANTNTMAQDITTSIQPKSSPSLSSLHKRKATETGVDESLTLYASDQQQQHTEKVIVLDVTDDNNDTFQPTPLQPQPEATHSLTTKPKARAYPKPNASEKSKAPRKKVKPKTTTSCKQKMPVKPALASTLAPTNVQSTMPPSNTVSTSSCADSRLRRHAFCQESTAPSTSAHVQSPANTHMQLPTNDDDVYPSVSADSLSSNHGYSEHHSESTTPYYGPPIHDTGAMASFYRDLASCYQAPALSSASDAHSSLLSSRTEAAFAPTSVDYSGTVNFPASHSLTMANPTSLLQLLILL